MSFCFENIFVGRFVLDLGQAGDALRVSMGQDHGIEVKREPVSDFSGQTVLGSKRKVQRTCRISLRNNKEEELRIRIYDQIPLSSDKSIEVVVLEQGGGKIDAETGEIERVVDLPSGKEVEPDKAYEVRYPKQRRLQVE